MTMTITDLLGNLDTQQSCELPSLVPGPTIRASLTLISRGLTAASR